MYTWVLNLEKNPANRGTVTALATTGTAPDYEKPTFQVTANATPDADCGWVFDGWSVGKVGGGMVRVSGPNPLLTTPQNIFGAEGETVNIRIIAWFRFAPAQPGVLVRSSIHQDTLVRSGNSLIEQI